MKKLLTSLFLLCLFAMPFMLQGADEQIYNEVKTALEGYNHRLPGSKEYYDSINALEKILKSNGIDVKRQVYQTYVPEVTKYEFVLNGTTDVKVYPLSPNNISLITTGEKPIESELIYLPKDQLYDSYSNIEGKIALLDWGEYYYPKTLFTEGAKAIIFVGNDEATQWEIAKLQNQYNISFPYFYITREEAEAHGLLKPYDSKNPQKVKLVCNTAWKTVEGVNLWAEIKGKSLKEFELSAPEAVILGARMDTFGSVPGLVRSDRNTANIALLAQTAVNLSKMDLNRSFFLIFYGSAFNAYDGLRNFYFPYYKRNTKIEPTLDDYLNGYKEELSDIQKELTVLDDNPISKDEDDYQYRVRLMIRDAVVKGYNKLNYDLADINVKKREIDNKLKGRVKDLVLTPAETAALQEELKVLEEELKRQDTLKVNVANLRRNINERVVEDEYRDLLESVFIKEVRERLLGREAELTAMIKMSNDWIAIADAMRPYAFIGAYFFDFAVDNQPFILASRSYQMPHFAEKMDVSVYSKYFLELAALLPEFEFQKGDAPILEESVKIGFTPDNLSSRSLLYLPNSVGLALKLPGFSFRNVPGNYDYDEIPGKRHYELKGMIPVMDEFFQTVGTHKCFSSFSMIPDSNLQDKYFNYYYKNGKYHGTVYSFLAGDGKELDGPAAGAFAFVGPNSYDRVPQICGFSQNVFGKVNHSGYLSIPLVAFGNNYPITTATPTLCGAMAFDDVGRTNYINTSSEYNKLFRCYGGVHIFEYAPLTSNFSAPLNVLNGITDAAFKSWNGNHRVATNEGWFYIDKVQKAKLYWFEETFVLGEITEKHPVGSGISVLPEDLLNLNTTRWGIMNTIQLNLDRIEKLHKRNIFNSVVEQYHDSAEQHLLESRKIREEGDLNLARAHELFGYTLGIRAYRPLKGIINDLVSSVLILLILTIPFAFALERLLIGATNIYRQLAWVMVFFVQTFLMLYFTHPAFALSQAPMIIFIAFFIIVMSVIVIYIVMNRFKSELMAMQGLDTAAHRVNTENSMLLAAVMIGVSSMRNRPVKTLLTILTVILLTFTIISFASFESTGSVRPTYIGDGSGEIRMECFLAQHLDLLPTTVQAVRDMYSEDYDVFYRSASYFNPFYNYSTYPNPTNIMYNPENRKTLVLDAVVGFEPGEFECSAKVKTLLPKLNTPDHFKDGIPGVYISDSCADNMGLKVGDIFYIRSVKVRLDGIFKPIDLDTFTYLDNGKVAPPNYVATAEAEEKGIWAIYLGADVDSSNAIWSSPDMTVLTDYQTATTLNGFINAVVLYPKEGKKPSIINDATHIAEMFFGLVYSNTVNGVNRHYFTEAYQASGLSNLIVPLLLGALIILSSLLGSIADREREIFTFSALGLSPKDVSVLFFAESGVYAVIGGLGGYLLSQVTTTILTVLSKYGILEAPEMNYSSMSTVYTILTVMAIVLLSTIYPAIKAGRSASPDVARKWKMPPPDGDRLAFQFPFTVSRIDFGGILVFISEHFANHADSSLGSFAATNVQIQYGNSPYTDGYQLSSELTLAPFDLGVAEDFYMYSAPSDIEGVDVVTCTIIRRDGSKGAWMRGNRRFVDEIRNQFLLWRSLPVETVLHYREIAALKLKNTEKGV